MENRKIYTTFNEKRKELFQRGDELMIEPQKDLELHLNKMLGPNQFLTVSNLVTGKFESQYTMNIEKVLGYKPYEFTVEKLAEITKPDHLIIAMEFALIVMSLFGDKDFLFDKNYGYSIEFCVEVQGKNIRLERFCWVLESHEGKPNRLIDVWTKKRLKHRLGDLHYFEFAFYTQSEEQTSKLYSKFHKKWLRELQFSLTEKQHEVIAHLIEDVSTRIEIARKIGMKKEMLDEHIKNAKVRINDFIDENKMKKYRAKKDLMKMGLVQLIAQERYVRTEKQLLYFVKKYHLLTK